MIKLNVEATIEGISLTNIIVESKEKATPTPPIIIPNCAQSGRAFHACCILLMKLLIPSITLTIPLAISINTGVKGIRTLLNNCPPATVRTCHASSNV